MSQVPSLFWLCFFFLNKVLLLCLLAWTVILLLMTPSELE
jgi:hypothetical protein